MMAGGTVKTLALQLAPLAVEAVLTGVLAAPALVAVGADAGPRDGVAQGSVLTLTAIAAVRSPEAALTAWHAHIHTHTHTKQNNGTPRLIES